MSTTDAVGEPKTAEQAQTAAVQAPNVALQAPNVALQASSFGRQVAEAGLKLLALSRTAASRSGFLKESVETMATALESPFAALDLRLGAEVVSDEWAAKGSKRDFWKPAVVASLNQAISDGRAHTKLFAAQSSTTRLGLFTELIRTSAGATVGAMAIAAPIPADADPAARLNAFRLLLRLAWQCAEGARVEEPQAAKIDSQTLQSMGKAAALSSLTELGFAVANSLRNRSECDQVIFGVVRNQRVRVIAISGQDDVRHNSPAVSRVRTAMEECVDQATTLVYQDDGGWSFKGKDRDYRLHRQWHESVGKRAVATLPFLIENQVKLVVALQRSSNLPFTKESLEKYRGLVEPVVGASDLLARASRSWIGHTRESTEEFVRGLFSAGRWTRKAVVAATVVFGIWFAFGHREYEIAAPSLVIPANVRRVDAPFDGVLTAAPRAAGDAVGQGDVLASIDTKQLALERRQHAAQIEIARLDEARARDASSAVEVELARRKRESAEALFEITTRKIEQATLRAPFDGVVSSGDLRNRVGDSVRLGEPLFEISSGKGWVIEIMIPESEIDEIRGGERALFSSRVRPEERHEITIERVEPEALVYKGQTVFRARANGDIGAEWMRSGVEGYATIQAGTRSVWWISLHRFIDFIRLNVWI